MQQPREANTDQPHYTVGDIATVTVTGLQECVGRDVVVGFFGPGASPVLTTTASVAPNGTVAAEIPITTGGITEYAGAAGECINGGSLLSQALIPLFVLDPPNTGNGISPRSASPGGVHRPLAGALVVAGLLLSAAGSLAFARR